MECRVKKRVRFDINDENENDKINNNNNNNNNDNNDNNDNNNDYLDVIRKKIKRPKKKNNTIRRRIIRLIANKKFDELEEFLNLFSSSFLNKFYERESDSILLFFMDTADPEKLKYVIEHIPRDFVIKFLQSRNFLYIRLFLGVAKDDAIKRFNPEIQNEVIMITDAILGLKSDTLDSYIKNHEIYKFFVSEYKIENFNSKEENVT